MQSDEKTDSSWVVSSCLTSAITDCTVAFTNAFMVVLMDASWEAIVALSCWVSRKPDGKVLKQDSSSWPWVWAMRMGELKRERRGHKFLQKNDMDECDKGEEMNLTE